MRRLALLALVVPMLAGCGWASLFFGGGSVSSSHTVTATVSQNVLGPEVDVSATVHRWSRIEHLPAKSVPGAKLFLASGCTVCHTYAGSGSQNLNAPDLTAIGSRHLGVKFQVAHLRCPSCVTSGSPMPSFRSLGPKRLRELANFLEASKGIR